jgi:hypothetical protein
MSDSNVSKVFNDMPKLVGKENFVEWDQRLKLSFLIIKGSNFIEPNASPPSDTRAAWTERDGQIAGLILQSSATPILSAHLHLVIPSLNISPSTERDQPPHTGRASAVYHALKKTYGTSNAQYTFALGRRFIENKAGEGSVSEWVNQVKAQHRELQSLHFNLDALCVNVLLNGLPDRFSSYVDNVWTFSETPTIESVSDSILRIDAGHQNRDRDTTPLGHHSSSALVARNNLDDTVNALYAMLAPSGKKPSKEYPCRRCGSHTHWENDCTRRRKDKENDMEDKMSSKAETAAVAFVDDAVTRYTDNDASTEHLL